MLKARETFPFCQGSLGGRRFIYFGGDPIGTIAIGRVRLYGG